MPPVPEKHGSALQLRMWLFEHFTYISYVPLNMYDIVTSIGIIYYTSLIKQFIKLFLPTVSSFVISCKSNHS